MFARGDLTVCRAFLWLSALLTEAAAQCVHCRLPNQVTASNMVNKFDISPKMGDVGDKWVLSLPIPLRLLLAAQPVLFTPVLQVVHRVITRHLLDQTGLKAFEAASGAVTLIQRFGSAANLNIHLHCLVLDGVYRRPDGEPVFVQADSPTDEDLQALLHKIIRRLMKLQTRGGVLV